jgi:hypothetical protein
VKTNFAGKVTSIDANIVYRSVEPDESICVGEKTSKGKDHPIRGHQGPRGGVEV